MNLKSLLYFLALAIYGTKLCAQSSSVETLTKAFDNSIGKENLEISNGTLHVNEFRILNNMHQYYPSDSFTIGSLTYKQQEYYETALKYDIFKDIVVYKPRESEVVSINLIQNDINSFKINNRKFVYLNQLDFPLSQIKTGYYEEYISGKQFTFYIKHHKDKREVLKTETIFIEFDNNYSYFVRKGDAFYEINSKKDIIHLFPEIKRQINDYCSSYRNLKTTDEQLYYEKIFTAINKIQENNRN